MKSLYITMLIGLVALGACSDDEDATPLFQTDLQEITSHTDNGITITLFAQETLFVGYNRITAKIEDKDGNLLNSTASVMPMMDMMTMQHAAPIELSATDAVKNGSFEFNVVFVMPSGEMGSWSLDFIINETEIKVPVTVVQPEYARLTSFVSQMDETTKYFVAYIQPEAPQVGQNDLEIAIFKKQSMMEWPPVDGLTLELEPWMVSMDHGSPNNIAPVSIGDGHYQGKVNFTMTGDWQIRLKVMENGQLCGEPYFDIMFQ
ncbi:MAG: FixH family protein [Fulvivirga sp.]|uniref:FixH family protein n=1 Tax=Fulvivirga sp. TaxID=1931237 RepID=UPI0032F071D8